MATPDATTTESFHDFFLGAAGVAGALIGLLFVAISVAPERLLSDQATQAQRVRASTALTAFTNALSVSLFALIPGVPVGWTASIVSGLGILFVAGSIISVLRVRLQERESLRNVRFLVGVLVVFILQLVYGLRLIADESSVGAIRGICVLVVVCFLIGITRSWELIGGPTVGLRGQVAGAVRQQYRQRRDETAGQDEAP